MLQNYCLTFAQFYKVKVMRGNWSLVSGGSYNIQTKTITAMYPCVSLLVVSLAGMVRYSTSLSSSLFRALEVRADSLTFLPARDSRVRGDVMQCGLSCSSLQDCPAFSYSASDKLCTRLAVSKLSSYSLFIFLARL